MTRDPNGKMRFGIGQENADATGWDNVKGNVQKNRLNNPRIAPNANMQGFELPPTQTLEQSANNIYNGARRSMMSPVAMSPATQPNRFSGAGEAGFITPDKSKYPESPLKRFKRNQKKTDYRAFNSSF